MSADLQTLCDLDRIDGDLHQVRRSLDARARKHQQARDDLDSARERVGDLQAQVKEAKRLEHEAQRSAKRYTDRRDSAQRAIDGGMGDYDANMRQIEEVGRILDDLETSILEQMEVQDSLEHAIDQAQALVQQREQELAEADATKAELVAELEDKRAALLEHRAAEMAKLPAELTERYEAFRARGRRAVAYIVDKACNACNRDLMPQQFIELQRERLITCRNCKRWLAHPQ